MTEEELEQLNTSWRAISSCKESLSQHFYRELFHRAPSLMDLFANDEAYLLKQFSGMINLTINGVEQIETLEASLSELGEKHKQIGVTHKNLSIMEDCLIDSLQQEFPHIFTPEIQRVWRKSFHTLASAMKIK